MKLKYDGNNEYLPLRDVVFQALRQAIITGEFAPGERLMEIKLADKLGVSRTPVREAIRMLELEGLVVMIPRKGAEVARISEKSLRDVLEVRRALEPMAARRMTELGDTAAVEQLSALHQQFLAAVEQEDTARIASLDEAFHSAIVAASGNRLLIAINQQVNQEIKTFRSKTFQVPQNVKNAVVPHSSILRAIRAGDSAGAEAAMRAHLDKVQEDLLANIGAPAGVR